MVIYFDLQQKLNQYHSEYSLLNQQLNDNMKTNEILFLKQKQLQQTIANLEISNQQLHSQKFEIEKLVFM